VLGDPQLLLAALVLLASHGASFITNYIGRGEYLTATPDQQMFKPYPRMFALHLSIVLAGAFVISRGEPLFAVVLLVVFKTIVDLFLHLREHTGSKAQGKMGPKGIETTRTG
jgi:hypothetical protein